MRRELSAKAALYNSCTFFAHHMGLPFANAKHMWKYLADKNRKISASLAVRASATGKEARKELKKRAGNYPYAAPLGSRVPILPVHANHLHAALASDKTGICEKWQRDNIYKRPMPSSVVRKPYKPTRRAAGAGA